MTRSVADVQAGLSRTVAVVGVGQTDYVGDNRRIKEGATPHDSYGLAAIAFRNALEDAGIDKSEIDGVIGGLWTSPERLCEMFGIDPKWGEQGDPMMGIIDAVAAINAGLCECVAVIYGNNQRTAKTAYGGSEQMGGDMHLSYIYHAPWGFTSQGALYAMQLQRFMYETGFTERDMGQVAVAQRLHASLNPNATMRKRITIDDYLASKHIVEPLHIYDYCMINDGGVAMILMSADKAKSLAKKKPAWISGIGRYDLQTGATSLVPRLEGFYRPGHARTGEQLFNMAGIGPKDVSGLMVYDSFTPHIPFALEGYGYCGHGEAAKFFRDTGISLERGLPINTHGGHTSESYMQGYNHLVEATRQVRGECGDRQIENCRHVHYTSDVAGRCISIMFSA